MIRKLKRRCKKRKLLFRPNSPFYSVEEALRRDTECFFISITLFCRYCLSPCRILVSASFAAERATCQLVPPSLFILKNLTAPFLSPVISTPESPIRIPSHCQISPSRYQFVWLFESSERLPPPSFSKRVPYPASYRPR